MSEAEQSNSVNAIPELGGQTLPVTTVGLAVPDIEVAMNFYWEAFGWGGWTIYRQEPPSLRDMRYRGEVSEFSFLVAGTSAPGGFSFWVCQPLAGPSLYRDLVDKGTAGPHFLTIWRATEAESTAIKKWLASQAAPELMSARVEGSIEFAFYDARALCGFILETGSGVTAAQTAEATFR
jgi:hypothetical protein